jgi:hypothetical protein
MEEYLVHSRRIIKEEEIDGQDLVERICKIPSAVGSAKEARRLRPRSEFKL